MSSFSPSSFATIPKSTHIHHLQTCLNLARKSPPKPTNFRVGAVLVSYNTTTTTTTTNNTNSTQSPTTGTILSTGYTLELEGNTHAEQNALSKISGQTLTAEMNVVLYTSMEPCSVRLSGNTPCVERVIATRKNNVDGGVRKVVFGAKEPGTFVKDSKTCQILDEAGIEWEYISDLEKEILEVAKEGHTREEKKVTRIDDITEEERKRQEALPRNPKKRMMDVPPG